MGRPKKTPKTKTFTGCWTCRSRKVKCDCTRPSCNRCIKARLECQGYNVPLYWVAGDEEVSASAIKRQAMSLTFNDVDKHMQELDGLENEASFESLVSGPFGVFLGEFRTDLAALNEPSPDISAQIAGKEETEAIHEDPDFVMEGNVEEIVNASDSPINKGQPSSSTDQQQSVELRSKFQALFNQPPSLTFTDLGNNSCRDHLVSNLMYHYVNNVATILQPILHSRNTYNSIYATKAMTIADSLSWGDIVQSSSISDSKVALLYSLLTSSAFHLRGFRATDEADALARYFLVKAQSHLQLALDALFVPSDHSSTIARATSLSKREAVLSVMLTLVTADIMDGHMSEFWIHLDGTKELVRHLRGHVLPGSHGEHLINISYFLCIISDSTDVNIEPSPQTPNPESIFLGGGHALEFTYGITARLADLIRRVTQLAQNIAYYESNGCPTPSDLLTASNNVLVEIQEWQISQEALPTFSASDDITKLLASKHMFAFAQSIQIYYHTRVFPCDSETMQSLVKSVASHLTEIERIKRRTGYNAVMTATISWPGFIASCQAESHGRRVWTEWWSTMLEYGIGNIRDLWSVTKKAWELQDQGVDETPIWAAVLRQQNRRILAV
ncbi:hypothetical protein NM208_g4561 [Fusarium decemcellulare]|uniref:Uncharacterized protein n=1 Tax=Fusarium decemcellulare TaxID=57161 RepID=A0ACC1SKF5_9HYPO|nr:hypothetical protein NM208_g4561 [Fusarium decemcellulare]